jgi:hypothetical protein
MHGSFEGNGLFVKENLSNSGPLVRYTGRIFTADLQICRVGAN